MTRRGVGTASQWVLPLGTAGRDGFDVVVDDELPGWAHTGLRVVTLAQGCRVQVPAV